jgi:anaerobic ribonucleoside-triphosphate reductase
MFVHICTARASKSKLTFERQEQEKENWSDFKQTPVISNTEKKIDILIPRYTNKNIVPDILMYMISSDACHF